MRVKVDPKTFEPVGEPELIVAGRMGDDFCIDEEGEVIYLTTHRQNTIDVVSMDPGLNSGFTQSVAGDPYTNDLIGVTTPNVKNRTLRNCLYEGATSSSSAETIVP